MQDHKFPTIDFLAEGETSAETLRPLASYLDGFEYRFALETARWHALRAFDDSLWEAGLNPEALGFELPQEPTRLSVAIGDASLALGTVGGMMAKVGEGFYGAFHRFGSVLGSMFGAGISSAAMAVDLARERAELLVPADYLPNHPELDRYELFTAGVPDEFARRFWSLPAAAVVKAWMSDERRRDLLARLEPQVTDRPVFSWPAPKPTKPTTLDWLDPEPMPPVVPGYRERRIAHEVAAFLSRRQGSELEAWKKEHGFPSLVDGYTAAETPPAVHPDLGGSETPSTRRVVASVPVRCPECDSTDLRWGSSSMVYRELRDVAICNACGRAFVPKAP